MKRSFLQNEDGYICINGVYVDTVDNFILDCPIAYTPHNSYFLYDEESEKDELYESIIDNIQLIVANQSNRLKLPVKVESIDPNRELFQDLLKEEYSFIIKDSNPDLVLKLVLCIASGQGVGNAISEIISSKTLTSKEKSLVKKLNISYS